MTSQQKSRTRRRMAPEDRQEAILDAAQALFAEHGWEGVTIADVLKAAGISKGGFYHHFSAKEDLLTGLVARMARRGIAAATAAHDTSAGNALDRLNAFLAGSVRWKADNIAEMRMFADVMTRPGNDTLFQRLTHATAAHVIPAFQQMIEAGARDGTFDVTDPALTAEIIVGFSQGRRTALEQAVALATAGDLAAGTDLLDSRMRAEAAVCDRLLGLAPGSVILSSPTDHRRMLSGIASARERAGGAEGTPDE